MDTRDARHPGEAELFLRRRPVVATAERTTEQPARVAERPAVVRAAERAGVSTLDVAHDVPAMAAAVEEQVNVPLPVAGHDHGLRADRLEHVVVGLRDLARVPDVDPRPVPDALELQDEHRRVGVQRPVDAIRPDEIADPHP